VNRGALRGRPFPYRENSLNLFRLVFAAIVLLAHSFYTTGNGEGPHIRGENLGGWAVAGFFVVSGFLITRSRVRGTAGEYLLHRIVRIFPAFVLCLVVTAAVFGPIAALIEGGSLSGYASTPVTPLQFVWSNLGLYMREYSIGSTLSGVPYPGVWNGSLWTLYYEFLCYIVVWLLGSLAWFRRGPWLAGVAWIVTTALFAANGTVSLMGLDGSFILFLKLAPFFLGGALVYFIIDRAGVNGWIGAASLVISAVLIATVPGWGGQLSAPFLAYGVLWLSTVVPQPAWTARNDVSYGFYIYAWPVQQLLVLAGVGTGGNPWVFVAYNLLAAAITFLLGWISWVVVERPLMVRVKGPRPAAAPTALAPTTS
jgi:peptidoglycan/LPS O-acetylase OafA/YrhL